MGDRRNPFTGLPLADANSSLLYLLCATRYLVRYSAGREGVPKIILSRIYTADRLRFYF
jgi:hypothetical protein